MRGSGDSVRSITEWCVTVADHARGIVVINVCAYLLAPTGALVVTVAYYSISISPQPVFEILSISTNIFSFSF